MAKLSAWKFYYGGGEFGKVQKYCFNFDRKDGKLLSIDLIGPMYIFFLCGKFDLCWMKNYRGLQQYFGEISHH